MRSLSLAIFALLFTASAPASVVHLDDGRVLKGEVKRDGEIYVITSPDGTVTSVPRSRVTRLELTGEHTDPSGATGRLSSLRHSVANLEDLDQIITLYRAFIDQPSNASAVEPATADLQQWIQRRDQGLVKYGDKWVLPQDRDQLRRTAAAAAAEALELLQHDQPAAARNAIDTALQIEPNDLLALYLQAHQLIGAGKIPEARKALEDLLRLAPDHAPTLNNLAYIYWKQNRLPAALVQLNQAMTASPFNQVILDNVAEALNLVPESQRSNAVVRKTTERFAEQDARLQAAMRAQGWYRWGGSWINQAQFDDLQARQQAVERQMQQMEQQYADLKADVQRIEADVESNERAMRQLVANSYYRDPDGRLLQMPLPGIYYRLQRDNEQLLRQRDEQLQKQQVLRRQAQSVKDQLPKPVFSGKILPIGLSGAPVPPAAPADGLVPSSAPTSAPAPASSRPVGAPTTTGAASLPATAPAVR